MVEIKMPDEKTIKSLNLDKYRKQRHQGKTLKYLRNSIEKSQVDFAGLFSISQSLLSEWENSEVLPEEPLKIFSDFFNVSPDFFDYFNPENAAKVVTINNQNTLNDNAFENIESELHDFYFNPDNTDKLIECFNEMGNLREEIGMLKYKLSQYEVDKSEKKK